jgi:NAD+ kinase
MKAFIFARERGSVYDAVIAKLAELGIDSSGSISDCDTVITIGGDGTILKASREAALCTKPLLGINMGRLGFMATLEADELDKLARLKSGDYCVSRRILLDVFIESQEPQEQQEQCAYLALNDVVLHRAATARLPDFEVHRGDIHVLKLRADGMIIASPTGSTAYSLSAGGPIIEPELQCLTVTPVCPHTLFSRPMIFAPDCRLGIYTNDVSVVIDGRAVTAFEKSGRVIVTKSEHYLDLIDIDGNSFYNSIHNKLIKPLK